MFGHPAIAYLVAQQILDERREEARKQRLANAVRKPGSARFGRYRPTITKEVSGVPRTV